MRGDRRAAGQRDRGVDHHVMAGAQRDVAVGGGDRVIHIHVATRVQQDAAVGCRQRRVDVHVAAATGDDVALGGGDRRVDDDVAEGVHRQRRRVARRGPGNRVVDEDVAIAGRRVAGCRDRADRDAGRDELCRQRRAGDVAARADHVILRIDQPQPGRAGPGEGRDLRGIADVHGRRRGFDEAAIAADRCAGVECTAHGDGAGLHVPEQQDGAAAVAQRPCLDDAGIVHRGVEQLAGALRGHHDLAAISADQAAILHKRTDRALVDDHVEQPVARHVKRDRLAARQDDGAEIGLDRAVVGNVRPEQRDIAALCVDRAVVPDAGAAGAGETHLAGEEVGVRHIKRRRHQPADIHVRGLAEQDAVRVDQEHLPLG